VLAAAASYASLFLLLLWEALARTKHRVAGCDGIRGDRDLDV